MLTISHDGPYAYVSRELTDEDKIRYIRNGYTPPTLEREHREEVYNYARGWDKPNYPVPATSENAWRARYVKWVRDCYYWRDEALKEGRN